MSAKVSIAINGQLYQATVENRMLLVDFIREVAGLTGTHVGCSVEGRCGVCTVVLEGKAVKSCLMLAVQADGARILTIEGLAQDGRLHPIQEGFWEKHALQCGFCTPGMLMTARWLLDQNPDPSPEEIREAISGQVCRCTGYENIVKSVLWAAKHGGRAEGGGT